jgi:YfiH family protein
MHRAGFTRHQVDGIAFYTCDAFDRIPDLRHAFSTRCGELNLGMVPWDAKDRVEHNRFRLLSALGIPKQTLTTLSQIHSSQCHIINKSIAQWDTRIQGDALATSLPGVTVGVLVADCFPVLIAEQKIGAIAAVHAGWRGTLGNIVLKTLEAMERELGLHPRDALVAVGPGIRSCCLEVGSEVDAAFRAEFPETPISVPHGHKFLLDLPLALTAQISKAGVPSSQIFDLGLCTRCHPDCFFSYRAEGKLAGRQMGLLTRICASALSA